MTRDGIVVELALLNGERRTIALPSHTGSVAAVLDRLHDWVETEQGTWIQKRFIVEVRVKAPQAEQASQTELRQLDDAAARLAEQA